MDNQGAPKVSVCLPCYNAEKTIARTLESLLAQDYANFEILICDNSSTDNTVKIVSTYNDARIKLIINPFVKTPEDNWNHSLAAAKGYYVALYHADDLIEKSMIRAQVEFLETHTEACAVFVATQIIDEKDTPIEITSLKFNAPEKYVGQNVFDFQSLFNAILRYDNFIMPTLMTRKEVLEHLGGFEHNKFKTSSDLGMWLKLASYKPVGYLHQRLHRYRISINQGGFIMRKNRLSLSDYFLVTDYYLNRPEVISNIDSDSFDHYKIHKLHDKILLSMNLLHFGKVTEAKNVLEQGLSIGFLFKGIKYPRKLLRILLGYVFLISIYLRKGPQVGGFFYDQYYNQLLSRTKQLTTDTK